MKTACAAKCLEKWTPSGAITTKDAGAAGLDFKLFLRFTTPAAVLLAACLAASASVLAARPNG